MHYFQTDLQEISKYENKYSVKKWVTEELPLLKVSHRLFFNCSISKMFWKKSSLPNLTNSYLTFLIFNTPWRSKLLNLLTEAGPVSAIMPWLQGCLLRKWKIISSLITLMVFIASFILAGYLTQLTILVSQIKITKINLLKQKL